MQFTIEEKIQEGVFTSVYRAFDPVLQRRVLLKVLHKHHAADPDLRQRFLREAQACAALRSEYIVQVYALSEYENCPAIVMEFVEGVSLKHCIANESTRTLTYVNKVALHALRGLVAAHERGIIHRDIKPGNILVANDGTFKISDFGLASLAFVPSITAQGMVLGTPAYMSPEHISGAPDIDGRADVYGFGVLFFEALTGQLPYLGDPGPSLLVRILNEPAPKITLFRPDLPTRMVEIIERAMAKDASDRFPTLDDFVRAVEDYILPPSPLPRSLTPMAGVPMFALGEQKSGVADSVVQVVHRNESSGVHDINETKALFTLPREPLPKTREGDPSRRLILDGYSGEGPALTTTQVNLRSSPGRSGGRFLAKRRVLVAMFVAMVFAIVFVVSWFAFSWLTQYLGENEAVQPVRSLRPAPVPPVPVAAPVQAAQAPAPIPTPAIAAKDADVQPVAEVGLQPEPTRSAPGVPKANAKQNPTRTVASATPAQARAGAVQSADRREAKATASGTRTGTSSGTRTQTSVPRAGVLTPADF